MIKRYCDRCGQQIDDCPDNPLNKVKGSERLVKGSEIPNNCKDEPTWEQVKEYCNKRCLDIVDSAMRKKWYKDEPQIESKCPWCGAIISESNNYCSKCGWYLKASDEPQTDV